MVPAKEGYSGSISVYDSDWVSVGEKGNKQKRRSMAFHEIVEMFKVNKKKQTRYPSAHEDAIKDANSLDPKDERSGNGESGTSHGIKKKE